MPLSEHEQRLLEQMERALHEEDPKLASTLRHGSNYTVNGRQVLLGSFGVLLGLCGLLGGVITSLVVLGFLCPDEKSASCFFVPNVFSVESASLS